MIRAALVACLALFVSSAFAEEKPLAVPALPKPAKVDGELKDLAKALVLPKVTGDTPLELRVGYAKTTLYVAAKISDENVLPGDQLTVSLFFPGSGVSAHGNAFRFGPDGKRATTDPL